MLTLAHSSIESEIDMHRITIDMPASTAARANSAAAAAAAVRVPVHGSGA